MPSLAQRRLRWFGIGLGAVILLWLPLEDVGPSRAQIFGVGIAVWLALRYLSGQPPPVFSPRYRMTGLLAGLAVNPIAIALIIFKSGLHAHGFFEVSTFILSQMAYDIPWWGLGGVALGELACWLPLPKLHADS